MSFEGFFKLLCERGHLTFVDVYDVVPQACHCGEPFVWQYTVDQTNGYYPENDIELKVREAAKYETCEHCGFTNRVSEARYVIPKDNNRLLRR